MLRWRRVVGIAALLWAGGCVSPEQAFVTDVERFDPEHAALVRLENRHAYTRGELKIFLRTDDRFREDSLTVHVITFSPDSLRTEERHRLIIPRTKRINALKQVVEVPYRRDVLLQEAGNYYFRLTPTRTVVGVEAVGIRFSTE